MTASTSSYIEYIVDQLAPLHGVSSGRFFGGTGLAFNSVQFAMIMGNTLYFAVDDRTRPKYEQMGGDCFSYNTKNGRVQVRKYFQVPAEIIEDQSALITLANEAIQVAGQPKKRGTKNG
jgi:DNA transformation protein and related proteins